MSRPALYVIAFVVWTALAFLAGREWRDRSCDLAEARRDGATVKATLKVEQQARETEHKQADDMAEIGVKHEQDRTAAQAVPAAVVAELRAGTLKLRDDLATCNTAKLSQAVASAGERDAPAQLRAEIAADIVRAGRDADDQLRAAQSVIAADRQARETNQ